MKFFKGLLKYSAYFFIAAWMFLLGIMVGRGNSPVEFDTHKFQKRLETIAQDFGSQKKNPGKIDLKFYDVLDNPELEESAAFNNKSRTSVKSANSSRLNKNVQLNKKELGEILPVKEIIKNEDIPLKISKKKETFQKRKVQATRKTVVEHKSKDVIKKKKVNKKLLHSKPAPKPELQTTLGRKYTVQIAAYKNFKDAVSQMAILQKKGFSSYRVKGIKDGVTWYRVRSGSFASFNETDKFKKKLKKYKIDSLIIKLDRDNHENI